MDGDEVVQAYLIYPQKERMPLKELKGFKRVTVKKGAATITQFSIAPEELMKWDLAQHKWVLYPGDYKIAIGSSSEDIRLQSAFTIIKGSK
jgi:beta-glucosidase